MVKINKYKDSKGKCLFDEYMNKLKKDGCINEFMKIEKYIDLLKNEGNKIFFLKEHVKHLVYDLYELRPTPNRVLFFYCKFNDSYVMLHIFKKKTNKTPEEEIEKAIKEINEYERMIKNEK